MRSSLFLIVVAFVISLLSVPSAAQFGVAQKKDANKIQEQLQTEQKDDLVTKLMNVANQQDEILSEQDATDLAVILKQAAADPETRQMIARMQAEEQDTLAQLKATATVQDTMMGLKQVLDEMQMLEIVFSDKERALRLMTEEGMVDPSRVPLYQQNPALLEDDTRKGLYFTFVTLAVTAGFL